MAISDNAKERIEIWIVQNYTRFKNIHLKEFEHTPLNEIYTCDYCGILDSINELKAILFDSEHKLDAKI